MKTPVFITIFLLLSKVLIFAQGEQIKFENPILPGFYPDPSICRVGDTYYMVNSSFKWWPGLPIHRSKDLVNWEKIGHGFHRREQVVHRDGLKNSNGIFAPSIRYNKGTFYIICTLARETFLSKVAMTQQESGITPIFNPGLGLLQAEQARPDLPWTPVPALPDRADFNGKTLGLEWNFLRTPKYDWHKLNDGELSLELRPETVSELLNPSFIAQRTRHHNYEATTMMSFNTKKENEKAGLVIYRRHGNHYQLLKTKNEIVLLKTLQAGNKGGFDAEIVAAVPYKSKEVVFGVKVEGIKANFFFGEDESKLKAIGNTQDYTIVSDEVAQKFNGVYVGIYATSSGKTTTNKAVFDWFEYIGK